MLILTERCNLRCTYCYAGAGAKGADMDHRTALRALERLGAEPGGLTVELTGGEPLLNFDLVQRLVIEGQAPGRRFALQTNGLLLDRDKLAFLRDWGVGLGLSLDGPPDVNRLTRGDGEAGYQALRLMDELQVGVNLTVVLTRHNIEHLPRFLLTLAGYCSVRVVNLDMVRFLGRTGGRDLAPTAQQIVDMAPRLLDALEFVRQRRFPPLKVREVDQIQRRSRLKAAEPYCLAAAGGYAAVTPSGEVYPCASLVGREQHLAGHVGREGPIDLAGLVADWGLPAGCADCEVRFVCRGGCPSRRISASENVTEPYELECLLRRALYRRMRK